MNYLYDVQKNTRHRKAFNDFGFKAKTKRCFKSNNSWVKEQVDLGNI